MTTELAREVIKLSMSKHHGNLYNDTIDTLTFKRSDFNGKLCYYHETFLIFSLLGGEIIELNTNLLQSLRFKIINKRTPTYDDFSLFNSKLKYNAYLPDIIKDIRKQKIDKLLK